MCMANDSRGERFPGAFLPYSTRPLFDMPGQNLALADMVGGRDDALALHPLDDARRPVVADLQMALHEAGRGLALAADQRHRLVVEQVARFRALAALVGEE